MQPNRQSLFVLENNHFFTGGALLRSPPAISYSTSSFFISLIQLLFYSSFFISLIQPHHDHYRPNSPLRSFLARPPSPLPIPPPECLSTEGSLFSHPAAQLQEHTCKSAHAGAHLQQRTWNIAPATAQLQEHTRISTPATAHPQKHICNGTPAITSGRAHRNGTCARAHLQRHTCNHIWKSTQEQHTCKSAPATAHLQQHNCNRTPARAQAMNIKKQLHFAPPCSATIAHSLPTLQRSYSTMSPYLAERL